MARFFLHIYDFLQKRRRLCMLLLTLTIAVLIALVCTLRYNENIYDFLPLSGNDQKALTLYQDISGGQRIVAMFSKTKGNSIDNERLAEAADLFTKKLKEGGKGQLAGMVTSQVDYEKIASLTAFVYDNIPLLLNDSDYVRMERCLSTPNYAEEQFSRDVEMIMMPATGMFATNISSDPLALFTPVLERMQHEQHAMPFDIDNGYIYTTNHRYAIATIQSPYGSTESAKNAELVSYADSIARQTMQAMPDVRVQLTGSPVIAVGNAQQIKTDSILAIAISAVLIVLLLIFSFRNVKGIMLVAVSILFGWLFAMGMMAVARESVSIIVLGIASIIIGIAVNYPLHFVLHTSHDTQMRSILKDMVAPLLIGNITTVGAFASLIPLDAPALRDLGLFAAFMLIGTILFVLIFLPHLSKATGGKRKERLFFGKLAEMSPRHHRWLPWAIALPTVVLAYFSMKTSFDSNMHHINYMSDSQEQLFEDLHASVGVSDTATVYAISEGNTWDEALQKRQQLSAKLKELKRQGDITSYSDATTFIPSHAEQMHRLRLWNDFWSRHRSGVEQALAAEAPQYGFSADAFEPFFTIINNTYAAQPFDYFDPLRSVLLSGSFSKATGNCSVVDKVSISRNANIHQVEDALNAQLADRGYAFDFVGMNSAMANSLSSNFNYIGFACGFIVFIFLWLSFGRLELSLLSFLPMALGWIWILGIMYIGGMQFNIVNIILATFIFGQGDDYTIFMTDGLLNEYGYRKKLLPSFKNSIAISALIMFIGMGSLIVARHPALRSLAEVTIVGMVTVVFMAWVVPPLVFGWIVRTREHQRVIPLTIEQIGRTAWCKAFLLFMVCRIGILRLFSASKDKVRRSVSHGLRFLFSHLPGVAFSLSNPQEETFSRGCVLIANGQSEFDYCLLLALHPHVMLCMDGKASRSFLFRIICRAIGFIPLYQSKETLEKQISDILNKGYSVAICSPSSEDTPLTIARHIGAHLLPVYIHGSSYIMPAGNGVVARGSLNVTIGKQMADAAAMSIHDYADEYHRQCREIERTHFFHHLIIYKYMYKGIEVERETRRLLKRFNDFSHWIDGFTVAGKQGNNSSEGGGERQTANATVSIINARRGQFSLLMALVHPDVQVRSFVFDADDAALATTCEPLPPNLRIVHCIDEKDARAKAAGTQTINLSEIY